MERDKTETKYLGNITVDLDEVGPVQFQLHLDPTAHAVIGIEEGYLENVNQTTASPYNPREILDYDLPDPDEKYESKVVTENDDGDYVDREEEDHEDMDIHEALDVVLDLAEQNTLSHAEGINNDLEDEQERQVRALRTVRRIAKNIELPDDTQEALITGLESVIKLARSFGDDNQQDIDALEEIKDEVKEIDFVVKGLDEKGGPGQ